MRRQDNSKPSAGNGAAAEFAAAVSQQAEAKRTRGVRDGLVLLSIVIVSVAISMMLFAQLGLSLPVSAAAGFGAWLLFMLIHKQVQKSAQIAHLQAELARARFYGGKGRPGTIRGAPRSPLEVAAATATETRAPDPGAAVRPQESAKPAVFASGPPSAAKPANDARPVPPLGDATPVSPALGSPVPGEPASRPALLGVPLEAGDRSAAGMPDAAKDAAAIDLTGSRMPPVARGPSLVAVGPGDAAGEPAAARSEVIREHWSFRPRTELQPGGPSSATAGAGPNRSATVSTVEGDLEHVQRKIRELADEVNATEALRAARPVRNEGRVRLGPEALENSIDALKAAATSMRGRPPADFIPQLTMPPAGDPKPASAGPLPGLGELVIPSTAEPIAGAAPTAAPAPPPDLDLALPSLGEGALAPAARQSLPPHLAAVAQAIERRSVNVFLTPIVTLTSHTVSHYEMTVELKAPTGERLEARAEDIAHADGGLGAEFDIVRLTHAAALSLRMEARDKDGSLLMDLTGASFGSRAFLESFAHIYEARPKIAAQLVMTLSQRTADALPASSWQAVRDMHEFGFRFALDGIEHLATDFTALAQSGFRFIRFEARSLIDGLKTRDRLVSGNEIFQRATLAGLTVIANGTADAETQKRLLEAGVVLGQGALFGAPRQVKLDGSVPSNRSAA